MNLAKIKNLHLSYYFIFLFIITFYYLLTLNVVETYNAMTEWLINYQGGFTRRGLIGEFLYILYSITNIRLDLLLYTFVISLYIIFLSSGYI